MENISTRALVSFGLSLLAVAAIILVVILVTDDPAPVTTIPGAVDTTTTQQAETSTTSAPGSSLPTSTSSTTSSLPGSTSTSSEGSTTTTFGIFDEPGAVEDFVEEFAEAIDNGDIDFLYERLHPAVKATYDESDCRLHIEEEILRLEDYRQSGPVEGPFASEFGEFQVTTYEVPVTFTFEEADFESSASYSLTEGTVRWFAVCDQ